MFVHNINPVLVSIFGLKIRYYGLVYALGFLFVLWFVLKLNEKKPIQNLDQEKIYDLFFWMMLSGLIFARLFHVFVYNPSYYLSNPILIPAFWKGGMSIHGGLVGGIIAVLVFCKKNKIKFYKIADLIILPLPIILAIGIIANFVNGELIGTPSNLPWCVIFPKHDNVCRHPVVLYESIKNMIIFSILFYVKKINEKSQELKVKLKKPAFKSGTIFWLFFLTYSILRFIVQFWRASEAKILFGLDAAQIMSVILIILSSIMLWKLNFGDKVELE